MFFLCFPLKFEFAILIWNFVSSLGDLEKICSRFFSLAGY